jgi:hypothetical protein
MIYKREYTECASELLLEAIITLNTTEYANRSLLINIGKKQLLVSMLGTQTVALVRVDVAKSRKDTFGFDRGVVGAELLLRGFLPDLYAL